MFKTVPILVAILFQLASLFINLPQVQSLPVPGYSEANAYHEDYSHGVANANAGVAKIEGHLGPLSGHASGPEVGAHAYGGLKGVGYGVRASVGEIEGRIGDGPIGIGGKLGLSADTYAGIGGDGMSAYVLGTGVSITGKKGFEVCFLGSCLSLG